MKPSSMKQEEKVRCERFSQTFQSGETDAPITVDLACELEDPNDDNAVFAHWKKISDPEIESPRSE